MKNLEAEGIYGFGDMELEQLDVTNLTAVDAFKKEWDLSRWPWERVFRYFGQAGTSEIDIKKMMANLLWQRYIWLGRGILAHEHRSIETLWGKIEAAVGHHSQLTQPVKYDDYVSVLTSLIKEKKLFNYKDIDVYDMSSAYRQIGKRHPSVILLSEEVGYHTEFKRMAGKYGITYACSRPESPYLMMEYFTGELKAGGVNFKDDKLSVLTVISGAPDSSEVNGNSVKLLEEFSGADIKVHSLDGLSELENEVAALVGA